MTNKISKKEIKKHLEIIKNTIKTQKAIIQDLQDNFNYISIFNGFSLLKDKKQLDNSILKAKKTMADHLIFAQSLKVNSLINS